LYYLVLREGTQERPGMEVLAAYKGEYLEQGNYTADVTGLNATWDSKKLVSAANIKFSSNYWLGRNLSVQTGTCIFPMERFLIVILELMVMFIPSGLAFLCEVQELYLHMPFSFLVSNVCLP
jgi:hypothetical protein